MCKKMVSYTFTMYGKIITHHTAGNNMKDEKVNFFKKMIKKNAIIDGYSDAGPERKSQEVFLKEGMPRSMASRAKPVTRNERQVK